MHNLLIAVFFIAIVLSPCAAALRTLTPLLANDEPAKPAPARVVAAEAPVALAQEDAETPPTREGLLKCARSSQLRRFHIHHPGDAGEMTLQSLRPAASQRL
jgi:hypothetical protein